jgi:hypothetical protein
MALHHTKSLIIKFKEDTGWDQYQIIINNLPLLEFVILKKKIQAYVMNLQK